MKKLLSLFLIIIATLCLAIALPACKKEVEVVPFTYGFISEEELGDEEITEVSADKLNADTSFMVGASKYLVIDYLMKPQDGGGTYTYKVTVSPVQNVRPKIHSAKTTMTSDDDSGNAKILTATFNAPEADKKERLVVELVPTQEGELKISCQILADDQPTEYSFNLTKKITLRSNSGSTGGQEQITRTGLSYKLNDDKKSYSVRGIGFVKGDYVYVPGNYEGLPVTGILDNAFKNATFVEVTIADGIKKIGSNAFSGCEKLVSVSIGTGLEEIGDSAFKGCRLIRSIDLAETLQSIGNSAFENCTSLRNVTIPANVSKVSDRSFYGCTSLADATISNGVAELGANAFSGCNKLAEIAVPNSVTKIGNSAFANCSALTAAILPENLVSINESLFSGCSKLANVEIPNGIKEIGSSAFKSCLSFTEIKIPNSVETIGESAFYGCTCDVVWGDSPNITNIVAFLGYAGTNITIPDSVTSIGDLAFGACINITSITIPDKVIRIGKSAFSGCNKITSIVVPDKVTSVGESAFAGCSKLADITLPFVGATKDGTENTKFSYVFGSVPSSLKNVTITGGESIKDYAFENCASLESITVPENITSIGNSAFSGCSSLESIAIPDSVKSVGSSAFSGCGKFTNVTIPNGVISLGASAFENCSLLESITLPFVGATKDGTENTHFGYIFGASSYSNNSSKVPKSLKGVTITGGASIGERAFQNCSSIKNITIPDSVTVVGSNAFYNCAIETATIPAVAAYYIKNSSLKSVTIASGASIAGSAFSNCTSLKSVAISDSVMSIGNDVFTGCSLLTDITVDENNAYYKSIDGNLYSNDEKSLVQYAIGKTSTSFTIPDSVTDIGSDAFSGCSKLTSIIIPDGVISITFSCIRSIISRSCNSCRCVSSSCNISKHLF